MRKGFFVPYGGVMLPVGSIVFVVWSFLFSFSGSHQTWPLLAWVLTFGVGFVEAVTAYDIIGEPRALSVQRTKNVMQVGFALFAISFAVLIVPEITSRALSVETPFPKTLESIGMGAFLLSAFPLGGASLIVWDRWSSSDPDELEIPYWPRRSRQYLFSQTGLMVALSGFVLIRFPALALVLLTIGPALFIAGTILNRKSRTQPDHGPDIPLSKVELRKVGYEEKLATARKACELILRKLGRRVFAVCMWGDEEENSQSPYSGVDLLVVTRDGVRLHGKDYVFGGISVRIAYWQEIAILHRARSFDENWPWYSDLYRRRVVLYEKKGWLRKLDSAVKESDVADSNDTIRESALSLYHDMTDLRDNLMKGDAVGVRADCLHVSWSSISLVFLMNRRYIRSDYWKEIFECPVQPSDFRPRLEILKGLVAAPQDDMVESAEKLGEELLEMVRSRGIKIASSELQV